MGLAAGLVDAPGTLAWRLRRGLWGEEAYPYPLYLCQRGVREVHAGEGRSYLLRIYGHFPNPIHEGCHLLGDTQLRRPLIASCDMRLKETGMGRPSAGTPKRCEQGTPRVRRPSPDFGCSRLDWGVLGQGTQTEPPSLSSAGPQSRLGQATLYG